MSVETGQISDGYHTFDELYDHRITLWIALCRIWERTSSQTQWKTTEGRKFYVWRSKLHSDGTGIEGWFVLGLMPESGHQMTYHLPISRWRETDFADTKERSPEFDCHTAVDVLERLKQL